MSLLTRIEHWREAQRVRRFYTLITLGFSSLGAILCILLELSPNTIFGVWLIPSFIVWGIFSFEVDKHKPIYLRRKR